MVKIIKLTKGETNELLYKISEDNQEYGLIYKLIYVYGKDAKAILSLKKEQINYDKNTIKFKYTFFPLLPEIKTELIQISKNNEYLFLNNASDSNFDNAVDVYRKKLRYYLSDKIKQLDLPLKIKHSGLSITDLRRLRGQHLLLDGVDLHIIKELYLQNEGTTTQFKKYLDFDELDKLNYPCSDMDTLFSNYTDLHIFDLKEYGSHLQLVVSNGKDFETLISIVDGELEFLEDVPVKYVDLIRGCFDSGLLNDVCILKESEYKVVGDLSFIRV